MANHLQDETDVAVALVCATGWNRVRGLIGRPPPARGTGLMFERCRTVHGCFMGYAIDVVFIDGGGRVVRTARLRPWRALWCRRARHAIELRAGEAAELGLYSGVTVKGILAQKKVFAQGG